MDITEEQRREVGFAYQYAIEHQLEPEKTVAQLIQTYTQNQKARFLMEAENDTEGENYNAILEEIQIAKYRLENNKTHVISKSSMLYSYDDDMWNMMDISISIMTALSIFIVILAGGSIASEFSNGTIKFLLINPIHRRKVFFSKYFTLLSVSIIFTALLYLIQLALAAFLFGGNWSTTYITIEME